MTVLAAPETAARYEMLGLLGEGGHARVMRAYDCFLQREVAMKILLPEHAFDTELRSRFAREARTLAALDHPNLVRVYEVCCDAAWPYYTMELLRGQTLAELLTGSQGLAVATAAPLFAGVCTAVDHLHAAGLVHRDIKAANVFAELDRRAVLIDLGIARLVQDSSLTPVGGSLGTPENMSPEQIRGEPVGPAADVYALGVLAFQLLCGRPPFEGETSRVLHDHVRTPPPPLRLVRPGLPEQVYEVVEAALSKRPEDRPWPAGVLAAAFSGASAPAPDDGGNKRINGKVGGGDPLRRTSLVYAAVLAACIFAIILSLALGFAAG